MFNSFVVVSLVASVTFAGASSLIPSGISDSCSGFLQSLDNNSDLQACTKSLISATAAYGPDGNAKTPTVSSISGVLDGLCPAITSGDSSCPDSTIRTTLATFALKCNDELVANPNNDVIALYDVLYAITPLKSAICAKDDTSGAWCLASIKNNIGDSSAANTEKYLFVQNDKSLSRRDTPTIQPNATTFQKSNVLFGFLSPKASNDVLCTTCTRNMLQAYMNFESSTPYAPGLLSSELLGGQPDLVTGITNACGDDFFNDAAVQAAGGLANGPLNGSLNAAPRSIGLNLKAVVATVLGAVTIAFVSL